MSYCVGDEILCSYEVSQHSAFNNINKLSNLPIRDYIKYFKEEFVFDSLIKFLLKKF